MYHADQPATSIYLVINGRVKVCRQADPDLPVVIDIYRRDEFFGEGALVNLTRRGEEATALETTQVMAWTSAELEDVLLRRPRLALALVQMLVQRSNDFGTRIVSFSADNTARRLARSLLRLADRMGERAEDGSVHVVPFTHQLLSQYVGTSREIVTHYMNQFRRDGYIRYSRKGMDLYADALHEWLRTTV
jgi:CRP-like cAMP-binding protein